MDNSEANPRLLQRDCAALSVPWGKPITLEAGSRAVVTQRLGRSITLIHGGNLYRIDERDADALGLDPQPQAELPVTSGGELDARGVEQAAWEQLANCYDPEIPFDIVSLGLVYGCTAEPLAKGGYRLSVSMTLTAPGCGMGSSIADEARTRLLAIAGVREVEVLLVWDPPWSREMISEAARLEMGIF